MIGVVPVLAAIRFETTSCWPAILVGLAGLAVVAHAYTRGLRRDPRFGRPLLLGLRAAAVLLVALALLHPAWISEKEGKKKPRLAVLLDNSLSMAEAEAPGKGSRFDKARGLLLNTLLPRWRSRFEVSVFDVRGALLDIDRLPSAPTEDASPLTAGLLNIQRALSREPLRGIVALSDGREISPPTSQGSIDTLQAPVFAVDLAGAGAGEAQYSDLSIQAVIANDQAIVDNTINATVLLASDRMDAPQTVELLLMEGEAPVARKLLRWERGEVNRKADLEFVPRRSGRHAFTVRARRVDKTGKAVAGDDPNMGNNWANFSVLVHPGKLTVLYVDGVLRWESKFIREALNADPDINLLTAIRTTPREAAARSEGVFSQAQLANIDVVILGDIEAKFFEPTELVELRNWVIENGGGLLFSGGYLNFGPEGFADSPIGKVLPIVFPDPPATQIEKPFNIRLTEDGVGHPIFHVTGEPARDRAIWHSLPKLPGCCRIAAVKPGARVLAVNPEVGDQSNPHGLPVIVEHQVGKGKAIVMAVDCTWLWRTIVGGYTQEIAFYRKFWGQTIRYLAPQGSPEGGHELSLATDRTTYSPDDQVEVFAEMKPKVAGSTNDVISVYRFTALVTDEDGKRRRVQLNGAGPNRLRGSFKAMEPGRQEIAVAAEPIEAGKDRLHQSQVATIHVVHPDRERHETRPDPEWLQRVAQMTGGRFTGVDEVNSWRIEDEPAPDKTVTVTGLWYHRFWGVLLFGLFCSEWILRRLGRLA